MAHPFLPMMAVFAIASAHPVDLNAKSKDPISLSKANSELIFIAGRDGPADGDDPHGDDPHDENRNGSEPAKKMPARDHRDDYKAPKDPYGGEYPQGKGPNW
jgi:hypothetical protein